MVIRGADSKGNRLAANFIGHTPLGVNPLGNKHNGVLIVDAPDNVIGGGPAAEGNVISSNHQSGIRIEGPLAGNNVIQGNLIGTNFTGADRGNRQHGIRLVDTHHVPHGTIAGHRRSQHDRL